MDRRAFLRTAALASLAAGARQGPGRAGASAGGERWRAFEVTTRVEILNPSGLTRAWVPLPLTEDTDYQKTLGRTWSGNAVNAQASATRATGPGSWSPSGRRAPPRRRSRSSPGSPRATARSTSSGPAAGGTEDAAVLRRYLEASDLIRTDGIVEATAREITRPAKTDVEKARALYEWIVDNTFRDPKVKGCGLGDIQTMLETQEPRREVRRPERPVRRLRPVRGHSRAGRLRDPRRRLRRLQEPGQERRHHKAQHCRAEFYLAGHGWVPVDPADVRKVVLEEKPGGLPLDDPQVQKARAKLFGAWEMNWMAYNYAHDVKLPGSSGAPVAFLMYPQAETGEGRRDSLDPDQFRYTIKSREIAL